MSNELEAFVEYISVAKALSRETVKAYRRDLQRLEEQAGGALISLDEPTLLKALSTVENRRTLNRKLSSLNAFYDFCRKSRFEHAVKRFRLSKLPKVLPKFMSSEEILSGAGVIDRSGWIGLRDYALILVLYATGVRISECLEMQHGDIEGEWLRVRHGKGEKERLVPVAPEALEALRRYTEAMPFRREKLWVNYRGGALSRVSAYKIVQKYLDTSPHTLRHSFATALILGGADLRVVQELLGHASLLTTQIYTHIQKQNLRETVNACHPLAGGAERNRRG